MSRRFKPNLDELLPTQQDDTTTVNFVYTRFGSGTKNEYLERQETVSPYTHEWAWALWVDRASIVSWVDINQRFIDY